jgi:hypothetical protein
MLGCLRCAPGHVLAAEGHFTILVLPDAAGRGIHDAIPLVAAVVDEGVPSGSGVLPVKGVLGEQQCGFIWPLCSLLSLSSYSEPH